jgi:hypothetical protein
MNTAARIFHIRLWPAFSAIIESCFPLRHFYAASQKAVLNHVLQSMQKTYIAQGFLAYPGDHARFFQGTLHKNWMKLTQMLPHIQLSLPLCTRSAQSAT